MFSTTFKLCILNSGLLVGFEKISRFTLVCAIRLPHTNISTFHTMATLSYNILLIKVAIHMNKQKLSMFEV
jgi:hypothetical protein